MIEIQKLVKNFGPRTVLDNVSFECRPGTVTGFLGPNGAGKSTTLRILCGLMRATSGSATFNGDSFGDLGLPAKLIGVSLDASAMHPGRSGRSTLRLQASLLQEDPRRADELLEYVGLTGEGRKLVGAYSLGMRQRLAVAHALVGSPRVLVLDEPANGLDPEGIRWMRTLLHDFAAEGGTVLLSSHLLHEVEVIADHLVVIHRGSVVGQGALSAFRPRPRVVVEASDMNALRAACRTAGLTYASSGESIEVDAEPGRVGELALQHGLVLQRLARDEASTLEQVFLELTHEGSEAR